LKLQIRAAAARDLDEAATWYGEHAIDPRVPIRFLLEVRAVFETIAETPHAFPEVHRDVRRCRVLAFPAYSVFYRVVDDVDRHRSTSWWTTTEGAGPRALLFESQHLKGSSKSPRAFPVRTAQTAAALPILRL
jgi:plasmid stabilization system protein ParE